MLKIDEAQMATFVAAGEDRYVARAMAYAREHLAGSIGQFPDDRLAAVVREARDTARAHGVGSEHGFILWLLLAGRLGPTFHQQPDIAYALTHSDDRDQLLDVMVDRLAGFEQAGRG